MLCSCGNGAPVFYIDGELPEIGEYSGKNSAGRFYDSYTPVFLPSDDYGTVIPFIGSNKIFRPSSEFEYGFSGQFRKMGFCTPDGRIVMDASGAYSDISHHVSADGFEYYTLYSPPQSAERFNGKTTLISADGSIIMELPEGAVMCSVGEGKIVSVSWDYPNPGVWCHSYDGKLLFSFGESYGATGVFSHGMLAVSNYKDGTDRSWFVNEKGEKVLGDYEYCSGFTEEGIAVVREIGGKYCLINTSGDKLTDEYENLYITQKNYYCAQGEDFSQVLSPVGEVVCTIPSGRYFDFAVLEDGKTVYNDYSYKRCTDGSEIVCKENGYPAQNIVGNKYFVCKKESVGEKYPDENAEAGDKTGYLVDYDGNLIATLEDFDYACALTSDGLLVYSSFGNYENNDFKLTGYDINKKEQTFCYNTSGYAYFLDEEERYLYVSLSDHASGQTEHAKLYDAEKGRFVLSDIRNLQFYKVHGKEYFAVATDALCTLYNENFEKIYQTVNE